VGNTIDTPDLRAVIPIDGGRGAIVALTPNRDSGARAARDAQRLIRQATGRLTAATAALHAAGHHDVAELTAATCRTLADHAATAKRAATALGDPDDPAPPAVA
jgi:hypothetical protein